MVISNIDNSLSHASIFIIISPFFSSANISLQSRVFIHNCKSRKFSTNLIGNNLEENRLFTNPAIIRLKNKLELYLSECKNLILVSYIKSVISLDILN